MFDTDPEAPKGKGEVTVKVVAATPPALPAELPGLLFRPVIFDDLVVVSCPTSRRGTAGHASRTRFAQAVSAPPASRKAGDS